MDLFKQKIDFSRIPIHKLRRWFSIKTKNILGIEDEIFIDYCINQLKYKTRESTVDEESQISPKELISNIKGFLGESSEEFVFELWNFLLKQNKADDKNFKELDKNVNSYSRRSHLYKNVCRKRKENSFQNLSDKNQFNKYQPKFCYNEKGNYQTKDIVGRRDYSSQYGNSSSDFSLEILNKKTTRTRKRSLSRSLSPGNYRCDLKIRSTNSNIQDLKNNVKNACLSNQKFSYDSGGNLFATVTKVTKNESLYKINNFNKDFVCNELSIDKNTEIDKISLDVSKELNNIEKEQLLRTKALELIKRKNFKDKTNNRTKSEEILRARALEKLIKKK